MNWWLYYANYGDLHGSLFIGVIAGGRGISAFMNGWSPHRA